MHFHAQAAPSTDPDCRYNLIRPESKSDRVQDAIVSRARMAQRKVTLFRRMDNDDADPREAIRRIGDLKRITLGREGMLRSLDRGGVAIRGAAVALAFKPRG